MSQDSLDGLTRRGLIGRTAEIGGGVFAAGGLAGYLAACGGDDEGAGGGKGVFRLGATPPLTGFAAADGVVQRNAQKLAVEEWNAKGGVLGMKIETTFLDLGEFEAAHMISVLRQLIEKDKVDAIITGYNTFTGGAEYEVMAGRVPYLHVHTLDSAAQIIKKDPDKYWNIWQYDPSEKWYGLGFPAFIAEQVKRGFFKPRNQTISIIHNEDPYDTTIAENLRDAMQKAGWSIPQFEKVSGPLNEWGPVLQKVRGDNPDVVFLADVILGDQVSFIQQFRREPTQSLVYGQYIPSLPDYREQAGEAAERVIWSTVIGILPTKEGEAFRKAYTDRWGSDPGSSTAGYLYDGTNMYLTAVKEAGTKDDHKKILDTMTNMGYQGVCGTYDFNKDDHTALPYPEEVDSADKGIPHLYVQIQNGKDEIVFPQPVTSGDLKIPSYF